jgi:LPXTG-motif cell wall-anchored protein
MAGGEISPGRYLGFLRWRPAAALALTALAIATSALPAAAAGAGGNGSFSLTPAPDSDGQAVPYFTMTVAAGDSASATVIVSNLGHDTEKLKLGLSSGVTAGNGGSAFSPTFQGCTGDGCWVTGVPGTVTLPADTGERLLFTVHVPPGTAPGQYLAGLSAEPAQRPQPVGVGSNGKSQAQAVIIEQVTVGVAVTVGSLPQLITRLQIPGVSATAIGKTARLDILLRNTGQTFAHGTGKASCTVAGKLRSFEVVASTVLPGDQAVIAVNAPGIPEGPRVPCTVRLDYGSRLTASWSGSVAVPVPPRTRIIHTGPGVYAIIPSTGVPAWAIALMVIGVLALAAVAALLLQLRRRATR